MLLFAVFLKHISVTTRNELRSQLQCWLRQRRYILLVILLWAEERISWCECVWPESVLSKRAQSYICMCTSYWCVCAIGRGEKWREHKQSGANRAFRWRIFYRLKSILMAGKSAIRRVKSTKCANWLDIGKWIFTNNERVVELYV